METIIEPRVGSGVRRAVVVAVVVLAVAASLRRPRGQARREADGSREDFAHRWMPRRGRARHHIDGHWDHDHDGHHGWSGADHGHTALAT
jgi:hypothetical protein